MKYQAVIFDLDGVICSTDQYHYQAWKAVADELNIPFDETVNHRLRGVSRMESFEILEYNKAFGENKGYEKYITNKYPDKMSQLYPVWIQD